MNVLSQQNVSDGSSSKHSFSLFWSVARIRRANELLNKISDRILFAVLLFRSPRSGSSGSSNRSWPRRSGAGVSKRNRQDY